MGYPAPAQFLKQIGTIADSPVSPHDGARGLNIYGRGMYYMKGKETWRPAYFPEPEEIPRVVEQVQKLHMDIVFIFGIAFLISVSFSMDLTVLTPLGKLGARSTASIRIAIPKHINVYRKHGFLVKSIHTDREGSIAKVVETMESVTLVPTAAGEKDPIVECKIVT